MKNNQSKELFTNYYETNFWGGRESRSGPGSDKEPTRILIQELQCLFKNLQIKSLLDLPCGDWNWMQDVDLSGIDYFGGDIVESLIRNNRKRFEKYGVQFHVLDVVSDPLPCVELVIVRDCFIHLSNQDIRKALTNIKASGSKWLLTSHYPWLHRKVNGVIGTGGFRRVDLTRPPFNLSPPRHILFEFDVWGFDSDKSMALWPLSQIWVPPNTIELEKKGVEKA